MWWRTAWTALIALLLSFNSAEAAPTEATSYNNAAIKPMKEGRYEDALPLLQSAAARAQPASTNNSQFNIILSSFTRA